MQPSTHTASSYRQWLSLLSIIRCCVRRKNQLFFYRYFSSRLLLIFLHAQRGSYSEWNIIAYNFAPASTIISVVMDQSALCAWLKGCGCTGIDDLLIKPTTNEDGEPAGLGCFAKRNFRTGEVMFEVPQECIFSISDAIQSPLSEALIEFLPEWKETHSSFSGEDLISGELLIWIEVCRQRSMKSSKCYHYFASLTPKEPTVINWDETMTKHYLSGTNLSVMVNKESQARMHAQLKLVNDFLMVVRVNKKNAYDHILKLLPDSPDGDNADFLNGEAMMWARGHYLSRRYPGRFARGKHVETASNKMLLSSLDDSYIQPQNGFGNLGALVPLLDIVNNKPDREWLKFEVTDSVLKIICNHPVKKGEELFSNYGALSNEVLLFAYGYAVKDNEHDSVAVKLSIGSTSTSSSSSSGSAPSTDVCNSDKKTEVFYLKAGGNLSGVPPELWATLAGNGVRGEKGEEQEPSSLESQQATRGQKRKLAEEEEEEEEDDDNDNKSDDEEPVGVEVGIEEVEALHSFLRKKYDDLSSISAQETPPFPSSFVHTAASRSQESFLKWYRQGQVAIMKDIVEQLEDILDSADGEEEDEEESEE